MNVVIVSIGVVFAALSSFILAYISIATMVGPWIAPTLVLIASILLKFGYRKIQNQEMYQALALIQTIGSVGGIVGMAIGFSLPTLYFLNPEYFNNWLQSPVQFCALIAAVCLAAGSFGIWFGKYFAQKLLHTEKLSFPVSQLIYKGITSQSHSTQARALFSGMSITTVFCFLRDGLYKIPALFQKTVYIAPSLFGRELAIAFFPGPTLWAIGFTTGAVIAMPLLVGMISKYIVLWPLQHHTEFLGIKLFPMLSEESFTMAFCSGIVLSEVLMGLMHDPKIIWHTVRGYINSWRSTGFDDNASSSTETTNQANNHQTFYPRMTQTLARMTSSGVAVISDVGDYLFTHIELIVSLFASVMVLYTLGFSIPVQAFILFLTAIATYQICYLGGKVGLLPFGRFATLVMIPTMLVFGITNHVQLTFICVFVNICSGLAADLLFDYKVGELCGIAPDKIHRAQWIGLFATALCMGFFLWLLFTNFQLGSPELFAQRGKSRALLIQSINLDPRVLLFGLLYGFGIKHLRISPALTLGGILMPNSVSIGLILGGLCSKLFKSPEKHFPFWSGVFAAESLWILLNTVLKMCGL